MNPLILPYFLFFQHETGQLSNCESTTNHLRTLIKEEPDFVETHCHWTGCDRDLHTQEQLVKVKTLKI